MEPPPDLGARRHWTIEAARTLIDSPWLRVIGERVRTPSGALMEAFYRIDEPDWACAIPRLGDGRLVLVSQYRRGAGRVTLEFPAGDLEAGEDPAAAAIRELAEETGHAAVGAPLPLGRVHPEPARNGSVAYGFVVEVAEAAAAQVLDHGEDVGVHRCSLDEVVAAVDRGLLCHGTQLAFFHRALADGLLRA